MTHQRNRVGSDSLVKLLQESLWVALKSKALKAKDLKRVTIDTTVQEKAVQYPTEAALHYKAIEKLSHVAKDNGIELHPRFRSNAYNPSILMLQLTPKSVIFAASINVDL